MTSFTTRPEITGTFGVVTSTHWIASAVGMRMLELDGNAFDATAASGFALQVVEPHLNGPGGDMPVILYTASEDRVRVLCGQGTAPAAATIPAFQRLGLDLVPGNGLLAACVPGAVDAWLLMLRDYGRLRLRDVLEPAIAYAEHGHPILARVCDAIAGQCQLFLGEWPSSAATWLVGERAPNPGSLFRNPALAATWRRLLAEAEAAGQGRETQIEAARRAWSRGFVAEAVDRFCRGQEVMDVSGRRHAGFLTGDDMASWQASYEEPLTYDYKGFTLCKTGAWGQGPVFLQQLALLEGYDLAAMDPNGPEFVHTVIEAIKLAFADREAYYGDERFVEVPVKALLARDYNDRRRQLIGPLASLEPRPGVVPGFEQQSEQARRRILAFAGENDEASGEPTFGHLAERRGRGDTCHIDVIDRWGNMVAATPSGGWLQSSPVIPELGFPLGTRAQMFWLEEGLPASLAPGKRPRTTLSPSLALKDGRPWLAFGTPGGDQQDQWQPILFLRHVHHALNLQQAIDAPLFHSEHFPSSFWPRPARLGHLQLEASFPEATIRELRRRGHILALQPEWSIGRLCAAAKDGQMLKAAATPRHMQAYAVGR